jgi:hypothetical protein
VTRLKVVAGGKRRAKKVQGRTYSTARCTCLSSLQKTPPAVQGVPIPLPFIDETSGRAALDPLNDRWESKIAKYSNRQHLSLPHDARASQEAGTRMGATGTPDLPNLPVNFPTCKQWGQHGGQRTGDTLPPSCTFPSADSPWIRAPARGSLFVTRIIKHHTQQRHRCKIGQNCVLATSSSPEPNARIM